MNKKDRAYIEGSSQIKEEKKLNYKKFWAWGIGLLVALMVIAYIAGFITFGNKIPVVKDSERKAYFEKDSSTAAAVAADAKMDSLKAKE
ncbi:hypothetical protein [Emticicia sp. SJ17W-69]|uniref:hypothetical protein n=1 Tax=Emticicia sp. SJ17W-69 TaxID=3421657 RepID=UPI003EBBF63C